MPFSQSVVLMNVQIQKAESTESTATQDLQEVSTTVAVNYRLNPSYVNEVYRDLRQDYVDRVIKPNIEESHKATTALFRAEELVTNRATVKQTFDDILAERLSIFNIQIVSVSLTDFQFSPSFAAAIDAKVTAEQQALTAKNKLEQVKFEAQQQIEKAIGEAEARIKTAEAEARAIALQAEALKKNRELVELEWVKRWNGQLPQYYICSDGGGTLSLINIPSP